VDLVIDGGAAVEADVAVIDRLPDADLGAKDEEC